MTNIAACCFCQKVRDDRVKRGDGTASWVTRRVYCAKYQLPDTDLTLSHTYCPDCLKRY